LAVIDKAIVVANQATDVAVAVDAATATGVAVADVTVV
jgi:hypothetical protein